MRLSVNVALNAELKEAAVVSNLQKLDKALLNSALSYAVYTKNEPWFQDWFNKRAQNPKAFIPTDEFVKKNENFSKDRLFDRAFAALIANKMSPAVLDLQAKSNHFSNKYKFDFDSKYQNGTYQALDNLAAATALTSKNGDGTHTLHVSFRGTDTLALNAENEKNPFKRFFMKAYLDMAAYYENFKPFEEAVLKYAADPKNNISKIEVSGHSLGGAMVQHFFRSAQVEKCSTAMQGFTYGSPPAVANEFYAMLPAMRHLLKTGNMAVMSQTLTEIVSVKMHRKDPRITQYQHVGDIVPKVGNLIMDKSGEEIVTLKDRASSENYMDFLLTGDKNMKIKNPAHNKFVEMMHSASEIMVKKPLRFIERMKNTVYHDMARYTLNLDAQLTQIKKQNIQMLNEKTDISVVSLCANSHSFNNSCQAMRLQHQSQARLLGFETDFNKNLDASAQMQKLDFGKMLELRRKLAGIDVDKKAVSPMNYSRLGIT